MFEHLKRAIAIAAIGAGWTLLSGFSLLLGTMARNQVGGYDVGGTTMGLSNICSNIVGDDYKCEAQYGAEIITSTVTFHNGALLLDLLILQVRGDAKNPSGTFDDGQGHKGALIVTAGLASVPIDAHNNLVAGPSRQIVIVELPPGTPPGTYTYTFSVNELQPDMQALFAGKVQVGGKTYYPPILPCVTDFGSVPIFIFDPNKPVELLTPAYLSKIKGCDNKVFDFGGGAPASANYQGIWWAAPAAAESGWGINFAHQNDTIFASWFTYDSNGRGWWLVMTANKTAPNTYSGKLYTTRGPAFNSAVFDPTAVVATEAGTGTLTFTDANNGSFNYVIGTVNQTKTLTREVFGTLPTCAYGTQPNLALATNYQDLWWAKPGGVESGWGINLNHEGDTIFATWFTYDLDGSPLWLVATTPKTSPGVYTGDLYRTTGPAYNVLPFDPSKVVPSKVGTATFTFADGNNASFKYTVQVAGMANPVTQTKAITRELFSTAGTTCQ